MELESLNSVIQLNQLNWEHIFCHLAGLQGCSTYAQPAPRTALPRPLRFPHRWHNPPIFVSLWCWIFLHGKKKTKHSFLTFVLTVKVYAGTKYALPLLTTAFELLQGETIFTKLEVCNTYHHLVRIKVGDEWRTTFNTLLDILSIWLCQFVWPMPLQCFRPRSTMCYEISIITLCLCI